MDRDTLLQDYEKALRRFEEALQTPAGSDLLRAGCIQYAFKMSWLAEETVWLSMLESRNRMAHTYDAERALEIYDQLPAYAAALRHLVGELRRV